ncbi:MAG: hypothetical protein A3C90_02000 [Candidatus Magasanikbacteria bacterium RIFCSPHIGHO2_02_FULL_51_14]|uniref:Polymerase nucleotidyl transferase domain-containing protein n=1 Tax=Candidatus Magasanikbacteria bacterium RIFCSPHIGHO2_02_FULL_51_14 TaxID=1798683 RepID=A0A1F6ME20_9BACT|nr:MAG: hypothetical protein A3C90_02000 [Candidatus Magasanikbacteria bacterium RIFCSPHIGHO2_02_FULL_51_14]
MKRSKQDIQRIKKILVPQLKKAGVTRASLFGSFARGDYTDTSDVDVLFEPPDMMSLLGLVRLERELSNAAGRKVDLVTFRSVSPLLKPYIEKDLAPLL